MYSFWVKRGIVFFYTRVAHDPVFSAAWLTVNAENSSLGHL